MSRRDSSSCATGNATCCGKCGSSTILDSHYRRLGRISPRNTRARPVGPLLFASWRRCGKSGMRGTSRRLWWQRPDSGSSDGALSVLHASIAIACLNAHPSRKSVRSANRRTSNAMIARRHPTPIPADVAAQPGAWARSRRATQTSRADTPDPHAPEVTTRLPVFGARLPQ